MKLVRDGSDDARSRRRLDDATAEALIAGDTGAGTDDVAGVSAFLHELRALGEGPPPSPSPALARMLGGGPEQRVGSVLRLVGDDEDASGDSAASNGHGRRAGAGPRRPAAGVVAKAAALALVATASVTGAAAARLLPEPAQRAVSRAIETVTPFEVPGASDGDAGDSGGGGGGAGAAMSRQGERFDPEDGDGAGAPPGDSTERRKDQAVDRPAAADGGRPTPGPTVGGDRAEGQPRPRPGPAASAGPTTTSPAPTGAPAAPGPDRVEPAPAPPAGGRASTATLTGDAGPGPQGDPGGSGQASVTVHLGRELLCVTVTTSGIAPVTSVHLHEASPTAVGPIVTAPAPAGDGSPACFGVAREVLRKVRTDPAGHYVEVHNAEFPDGALRGFLSR